MVIVSKVRACLTVDGRLVRDTHPDAAFLLVGEGSEIDEVELADRGFTTEQLTALEAEDAEPQIPEARGFIDTVPAGEEEEAPAKPTRRKSAAKSPAEPAAGAEGTEGA